MLFNNLIKELDSDLIKEIKKNTKLYFDKNIFDWETFEINENDFDKIIELSHKTLNKEDITFEIGYRYFRNNKLQIKKGVFVPQFDTEQIIDLVKQKNINEGDALEIGTGSGAISISLAKETQLKVESIDINNDAIELATLNAKDNNAVVEFNNIDFFDYETDKKFNLIISNPPYIAFDDEFVDEWVKKNQPKEALYAEDNGLKFYKHLFTSTIELLNNNGYIIVEIGFDQRKELENFLQDKFKEFEFFKDYEGHDRFLVVKKNE